MGDISYGDDPQYLVGGLEHDFYDFPSIGNVIIPTDELIFFRGVGQPPTRYLYISYIRYQMGLPKYELNHFLDPGEKNPWLFHHKSYLHSSIMTL
jgi:hypothetical protein